MTGPERAVIEAAQELVRGWHERDSADLPPCTQPLCQAVRAYEPDNTGEGK